MEALLILDQVEKLHSLNTRLGRVTIVVDVAVVIVVVIVVVESSVVEDGDIRVTTKTSSDQQLAVAMGDEVPSNRSVKRSSDRTTSDALKKIELDKRQKR